MWITFKSYARSVMDLKPKWKEKNPNYQKEYYEKNKEQITKKKRQCRAARREHYAEVAKTRYNLKRESILEKTKIHRKKHPEILLVNAARARAKKKNLSFNLTRESIKIPDKCPLLEIPLFTCEGKAGDNSPTLDRIIPELGYVEGNVWVISFKANVIKNSASFEEFQLISRNWSKYNNERV
jgi:hypothetical protein